jgi:drug/metabolite transporter (DMT)-like permease
MESRDNITTKHWVQLVFLAIIWGSSFILIKKALINISPIQLASFRIGFACLAFIPYIAIHYKKIEWKKWYKLLLVGLTTTGIPSFCFAISQTRVSSGTAGILNSLTPIFTLLISVMIFHEKFKWSKMIGVIIGFAGAALLIYQNSSGDQSSNILYIILILLATLCYGFNANIVKSFFPSTPSLIVSAGAFFLVGLPCLLYILINGDLYQVVSDSSKHISLISSLVLSLVCTVIANVIFYNLVQNTTPVFASSVTFLIPIASVLWAIFDGEHVGWSHLISMVLILIALILLKR